MVRQEVHEIHPRFETGADGARLKEKVTQVSGKIGDFARQYV